MKYPNNKTKEHQDAMARCHGRQEGLIRSGMDVRTSRGAAGKMISGLRHRLPLYQPRNTHPFPSVET